MTGFDARGGEGSISGSAKPIMDGPSTIDIKWTGHDQMVSSFGTRQTIPRSNALLTLGSGIIWTIAWSYLAAMGFAEGQGMTPLVVGALVVAIALGVFMVYSALAYLSNHTRVSIERGRLKVRTRPFPMRSDISIDCDEVHSLEAGSGTRRGAKGTVWPFTYIQINLRDGRQRKLLSMSGRHLPYFEGVASEVQRMVVAERWSRSGQGR